MNRERCELNKDDEKREEEEEKKEEESQGEEEKEKRETVSKMSIDESADTNKQQTK